MNYKRLTIRIILTLFPMLLLTLSGTVGAQEPEQPIDVVDIDTLTCSTVIDFDGVTSSGYYEGIFDEEGVKFAERFDGQTLTYKEVDFMGGMAFGIFDELSGTPNNPLTLLPGADGQNLYFHVFEEPYPNLIGGVGSVESEDEEEKIGEGAIAALFDVNQYELGFHVYAGDGEGDFTVNFLKRNGDLIQTVILQSIEGGYAFRRAGEVSDIAGISVHNTDFNGIGYYNFVICRTNVDIDIKPGDEPNCFNSDSHGVIPVAILGSVDFDATTVDPFTVYLDGAEVRVKGKSGNAGSRKDVNGDGFLDLVIQIVDDGSYSSGTTTATLTGETFGGMPIEGSDSICIRPPE